jgi:hypothetical protein
MSCLVVYSHISFLMWTLQYERPDAVGRTGVVFFRMLCGRPLSWAAGTDDDPYYNDANHITIQVELNNDEDKESYEHLIIWIQDNVALEARSMASEEAIKLWQALAEYDSHSHPSYASSR